MSRKLRRHRIIDRIKPEILLASATVLLLILAWTWPTVQLGAVDSYENVTYAISPSAARAFAYGERHLDAANNPEYYDINRAQYFFTLAAAQDPTYPYVYHELARISFLKGNFTAALAQIDFQIQMHGDSEPNSYYVRGLIEGYMGDYAASDADYKHFIPFDPHDWAAKNDDAWVLLKAKQYEDALDITNAGLADDPTNPWLLNSQATALYELGHYKEALASATSALAAFSGLTDAQWSHAYPGNDPDIAAQGVATFKNAIEENIHTINLALASSTIQ